MIELGEAKGDVEEPTLKRKKKSMDLREEARIQSGTESVKYKKDKKGEKKKNKSKMSRTSDPEPMTSDVPTPASDPEPLTDKARRKAEKKVHNEEKKLKKALKKAARKAVKSNARSDDSDSEPGLDESAEDDDTPSSLSATGTSTPILASAGLTFNAANARGMHAVRQRWIRQKKAATMDAQALKEVWKNSFHQLLAILTLRQILMVKASS